MAGAQFLAEAEHLKETDERAYRHEYLGEAVGTGGNVFENLELRESRMKRRLGLTASIRVWTGAGSQTHLPLSVSTMTEPGDNIPNGRDIPK